MAASMQGTNSSKPFHLPDTIRLIALTDGLFATVLTVLVLGFHLPEIDTPNLLINSTQFLKDIISLSPSLLSYVLTFLVAGSYWQAHHRVFETIPRTDYRLIWCNLMFLLSVGLLPFSTQLVGATRTGIIPWTVYCINIILIGLTFTIEWGYAVTHGLHEGETSQRWITHTLIRNLITPGVFLMSMLEAQFNTNLAYFFPVLIPILRISTNWVFPLEEPVQEAPSGRKRIFSKELFWGLAVNFPLILFAVWIIWSSNYHQSPK
jgi:uncharacterized membrane protein